MSTAVSSSLHPNLSVYVFTSEQPDKIELKLSDAFGGEGDIEVSVTMLNINNCIVIFSNLKYLFLNFYSKSHS